MKLKQPAVFRVNEEFLFLLSIVTLYENQKFCRIPGYKMTCIFFCPLSVLPVRFVGDSILWASQHWSFPYQYISGSQPGLGVCGFITRDMQVYICTEYGYFDLFVIYFLNQQILIVRLLCCRGLWFFFFMLIKVSSFLKRLGTRCNIGYEYEHHGKSTALACISSLWSSVKGSLVAGLGKSLAWCPGEPQLVSCCS